MASTIVTNVNLDFELYQDAIPAGTMLKGQVLIQLQKPVPLTKLMLHLDGKERTTRQTNEGIVHHKHSFFRVDVPLFDGSDANVTATSLVPMQTHAFSFAIPLPSSLPSTHYFHDDKGHYSIDYHMKLQTTPSIKFPNKRSFQVRSAPPPESIPCLLQLPPMQPPGYEGFVYLGAHVKDTNVQRGSKLQCSLACRNESTIKIDNVSVLLEEEYHYVTKTDEGQGRSVVVEQNAKRLAGIRVVGLHASEVHTRATDAETLARRMFQDLKNKSNTLELEIPLEESATAPNVQESYTGFIIQILHFLTLSMMPRGDDPQPILIRIPIHISSPAISSNLSVSSSPKYDANDDESRIHYPLVTARPEDIVLGRGAGDWDIDESFSTPVPIQTTTTEPSLAVVKEEMAAALQDYDYLVERMKDLDWAIFFASLNPQEYGNLIALVGTDFAQLRVAGLLAKNYGGDFTCEHCAEAIRNSAPLFRSTMVEGLLSFCADLAENSHLIREQLSEFEQVIVALHALNEADEEPARDRSTSNRSSHVPTDIHVEVEDDDESVEKPSSVITLDTALKDLELPQAPASGRMWQTSMGVTPKRTDVMIGKNDHPATKKWIDAIHQVVDTGDFSTYCPPVYRQVRKQFGKTQRFLMRPFQDNPDYWREATKIELIEQVGLIFEQRKQEAVVNIDQWNESAGWDRGPQGWHEELNGKKSDWDLAVTVHSYASGMEDEEVPDSPAEQQGPTISDICFFKPKHPGNAVLVRCIRQAIEQFPETPWSPPVYKAIKKGLVGRRFFVKVGDRAWREALGVERRDNIEKYFNLEIMTQASKPALKSRRATSSHGPPPGDKSSSTHKTISGRSTRSTDYVDSSHNGTEPRRRVSKSTSARVSSNAVNSEHGPGRSIKVPSKSFSAKAPPPPQDDGTPVTGRRRRSGSVTGIQTSTRGSKEKGHVRRKSSSNVLQSPAKVQDGIPTKHKSVKSILRSPSPREDGELSEIPSAPIGSPSRSDHTSSSRRKYIAGLGDIQENTLPLHSGHRSERKTPRKQRSASNLMSATTERRSERRSSSSNIFGTSASSGEKTPQRRKSGSNVLQGVTSPIRRKSSSTLGTSRAAKKPAEPEFVRRKSSSRLLSSPTPPPIQETFDGTRSLSALIAYHDDDMDNDILDSDKDDSRRSSLFRRLTRQTSSGKGDSKRNGRTPRDMDICYGSDGHPGTVALAEASIAAMEKFGTNEWSPAIYKAIRSDLHGRRFFLRPGRDEPWREATSDERVTLTQKFFEEKRRERRR
eukprot:Nitzschia sp. Nitz4//scaffold168_size48592//36448//40479//NITZ4_007055-RA/size48592-augustus-gene-0.20-mRNA-1//1//CDS//3329538336//965//frame0